jgi:hypothetical protein
MKYSITYSGFLGDKPIEASLEVESISITGCVQNFTNKMRNKGVHVTKLSIIEKEETNENTD